jgi:lysozyme
MAMTTGAKGVSLIKSYEGFRSHAYPDPASGGDPWTIGYGTTKGVKKGQVITESQAVEFLKKDLAIFESAVNGAVKVSLTQDQFDALVSFTYNLGAGNFRSSTLLKKVNAKDFAGAALEFAKWNKAAGKVLTGLTRRRAAEAALFKTGQLILN